MKNSLLEETKELLKNKGYKLTGPRLAILQYLAREKGHPDITEIYEGIKQEYPGIGIATVYRNIDLFLRLGIVRALTLKNSQLRYELNNPEDYHHHLICKSCQQIVEFGSCSFQSIAGEIEKVTRFQIDEHNLEVYGLCPKCLTA
ncbi:MAG: Fur family transcriptional regulator [Bacillota bacterium]